ncbi:hypothetical protein CL684_02045 [Candidatus Campbellbacteria bacterium]|nr:hypothetical protein [Candidatus Campbellbacteria bacterium]|tara:strand:+ start:350 stop:634 length:285 start_codon:yes stop_codon:yes gene_type:complete
MTTILVGNDASNVKLAILEDEKPVVVTKGSPEEMADILAQQTSNLELGKNIPEYENGKYFSQSKNKPMPCDKVPNETLHMLKRTVSRTHANACY